jgi:hypothetical protein
MRGGSRAKDKVDRAACCNVSSGGRGSQEEIGMSPWPDYLHHRVRKRVGDTTRPSGSGLYLPMRIPAAGVLTRIQGKRSAAACYGESAARLLYTGIPSGEMAKGDRLEAIRTTTSARVDRSRF